MALFGRDKDEDYEDEELMEEEREDRKFKGKLKDLNSKNKKKRKEPLKPWGLKERMIVLSILLITVLLSAFLAYGKSVKWNFKFSLPKINFSSLNIFKEETIIIEKKP